MTKQLSWFHEILELQDESYDASEFMEGVKGDIFSDKVYVFTPKGDVTELPKDPDHWTLHTVSIQISVTKPLVQK